MESLTITSHGHAIAASTTGTGDVPIVLLHAGIADRRSFDALAELLAQQHRVVAYDRRGFGETPWHDEPFTHLADLGAVLDVVAPGGRAWLVGSSMGGSLALDAATALPDRVAGLVLFAPGVSGQPWSSLDDVVFDDATTAAYDRLKAAVAAGDTGQLNEAETELWLDGPGHAGRVQGDARALLLDMNGIALRSGAPDSAGEGDLDAWARLDSLAAPTTVVWGDLDVADGRPAVDEIAARVPGARLVELADTAHLPYLEHPAACASIVLDAVLRA